MTMHGKRCFEVFINFSPNVLGDCCGIALPPTHYAEAVQCGGMAIGGLVTMYWKRCFEVFIKPFTKCSS